MNATSRRAGFTLIEMLVVMAIIGIVAAIILSAAWQSRNKAFQTACLNNMRQIGMGKLGAGSGFGGPGGRGGPNATNLECPMGATYALNTQAKTEWEAHVAPSLTVMLFESNGVMEGSESDVYPVHNGGANYVYWDGHAKWLKTPPSFKPL